jgi:hypothetical protein
MYGWGMPSSIPQQHRPWHPKPYTAPCDPTCLLLQWSHPQGMSGCNGLLLVLSGPDGPFPRTALRHTANLASRPRGLPT